MADLLLFRLGGVLLLALLGVLLIQAASAVALWRIFRHVDAHGWVIRGRAKAAISMLGEVEDGLAELRRSVDELRRSQDARGRWIDRRTRSALVGSASITAALLRNRLDEADGVEAEEGGDDGEEGAEAGPAEVEDPQGQRGA
ncbi:hypothetical protein [Paludisphaera soli]|uniref:hypothetical protein n=1 Tax=Paludisphaera soli TaxID=2712865 RepID=UPI0013EC18C8|nr:hypothetical protein [Paludisphaera soli]